MHFGLNLANLRIYFTKFVLINFRLKKYSDICVNPVNKDYLFFVGRDTLLIKKMYCMFSE